MTDDKKSIQKHYGTGDIGTTIKDAFEEAGIAIKSHADTATFDEFHIRGREATVEMAKLAELHEGMEVLDLGSGVGGPARMLAAEYGCMVTGVDLVQEYCDIATNLTEMVGLGDKAKFVQGDVTQLEFEDNSFDVVWTEHVTMNIQDKPKMFSEIHRVLKPGGRYAFYEVTAGSEAPVIYPTPWANDSSISHMCTQEELKTMLSEAGFATDTWIDVTQISYEWFDTMAKAIREHPDNAPTKLGLNLLMGSGTPQKFENVARNLKEDRVNVVQSILMPS